MKRWLSRWKRRSPARFTSPEASLAERAKNARDRSGEPIFYMARAGVRIESFRETEWFEDRAAKTVATADQFLRHQFDLLGSGLYCPVDPDRSAHLTAAGDVAYQPIDWVLDPVRMLRFPNTIPHRDWNLYEMRPDNADIKYPWELARCQHWTTLAQAWLLTGKTRFADEIVAELHDFREANPLGIGVNWTCTMDVAIRALNWAISLDAIKSAPTIGDDDWNTGINALREHGKFIFENFENGYEVTSNHYLSNIVGLFYLSFLFADEQDGKNWNHYCRAAIEKEIEVQVLPDGADFESSIPYHRLVTELFLGSAVLAEQAEQALSDKFHQRLAAMLEFFADCLRPDGRFPQVGDADDGRLHILTRCGGWEPQSGRHLLSSGGHWLGRCDWIEAAGPDGAWEAFWWNMTPDRSTGDKSNPSLPDTAVLAKDAGIAVFRRNGAYLAVTNGRVGTNGFGNHKHNDQLGFELFLNGVPLISDPGSFVYTSDFDARNRFRSTAQHSTVMVDGAEQNETDPKMIFRMFDSGRPEHIAFDGEVEPYRYAGRHVGYQRLDAPVVHSRLFHFYPSLGLLLIADRLTGEGSHVFSWTFACASAVETPACNGAIIWLRHGAQLFALASLDEMPAQTSQSQQSSAYGASLDATSIHFSVRAILDHPLTRLFIIARAERLDETQLEEPIARLERELEEGLLS